MPRSTLPPTPLSSTDLTGKTGAQLSSAEMSFALPPPAIAAVGSKKNVASVNQSTITGSDFSLPPPPTRSRKIIQMKPKPKSIDIPESLSATRPTSRGGSKKATASSAVASNAASKKQPSVTSAAGKKMARKTAHSVIERRRRSKMNEEFSVLKEMIPACKDQEMHKLAILQASIDYLRYLEQCINNLQVVNNSMANTPAQPQPQVPPRLKTCFSPVDVEDEESESEEDQEMANPESAATTPAFSTYDLRAEKTYTDSVLTQPSPALDLCPPRPTSSYASSASTLPSPAYGPQHIPHQYTPSAYMHSAPMSPMMLPGPNDLDREATDALLMLNKERRNPGSGRGMSVKDLLSS